MEQDLRWHPMATHAPHPPPGPQAKLGRTRTSRQEGEHSRKCQACHPRGQGTRDPSTRTSRPKTPETHLWHNTCKQPPGTSRSVSQVTTPSWVRVSWANSTRGLFCPRGKRVSPAPTVPVPVGGGEGARVLFAETCSERRPHHAPTGLTPQDSEKQVHVLHASQHCHPRPRASPVTSLTAEALDTGRCPHRFPCSHEACAQLQAAGWAHTAPQCCDHDPVLRTCVGTLWMPGGDSEAPLPRSGHSPIYTPRADTASVFSGAQHGERLAHGVHCDLGWPPAASPQASAQPTGHAGTRVPVPCQACPHATSLDHCRPVS